MMIITHEKALERYHAAYNNAAFVAIRQQIAAELGCPDAETDSVIDLMNALIDTCLACCGSPAHTKAHIRLAYMVAWGKLSDAAIRSVQRYLVDFQQEGFQIAEDFEAITQTLKRLYAAQQLMGEAAAHANGVHSWQGRTAYYLLVASEYMIKSAELLLDQYDTDQYLREKLKTGVSHLISALHEGVRHSDTPAVFDFHTTRFPDASA